MPLTPEELHSLELLFSIINKSSAIACYMFWRHGWHWNLELMELLKIKSNRQLVLPVVFLFVWMHINKLR